MKKYSTKPLNESAADKPLTIRQLIEKLQLITSEKFQKGDFGTPAELDDHVFFIMPGEDEGDASALVPVTNVTGGGIWMLKDQKQILNKIMSKEGVDLCFVKSTVRDV